MIDVTSTCPQPTPTPRSTDPFANPHSNAFQAWVVEEFERSSFNTDGSFGLFRTVQGRLAKADAAHRSVVWKRVLDVIRAQKPDQYSSMHKGEPFYWLALAAYGVRDVESAVFFMDVALAEDIKNYATMWQTMPAGLFVALDATNPQQAGHPEVTAISAAFEDACRKVNQQFDLAFSVEDYRRRLLERATTKNQALRSAVTTLITFVLEYADRRWQLQCAEEAHISGTAEPFLLHLLKGGLLFETLLKQSSQAPHGSGLTLNHLLTYPPLYQGLGSKTQLEGLGSHASLDDLYGAIQKKRNDGTMGPFPDVRMTGGLRNLMGHNLALARRPTVVEYDELFLHVFAAVARAISKLY